MRLDGRRTSSNVEDRRGMSAGKAGGLGIGGMIIVGIIAWLMGANPMDVIQQAGTMPQIGGTSEEYTPTPEEEELATFASQILAGTEDIWTEEFRKMGKTYVAPKLVLFKNAVSSGCGSASSSSGPFYCSADQCVYLDLDFFTSMKRSIGADGDFAYAYVIAHEVGHHVQYLLGTLGQAHQRMSQVSQTESNQISVRLELQADYFAGLWAFHDNKRFGSLEDGDLEEALNAAQKIGDDYLQKKARGYAVPESFNHGTSAQRHKWLKKGLTTGSIAGADTFSQPYEAL
ncbi:MAG: neutral zinc metallopeptidase [Bacteroidales bacterium]|nr:neutral zinc metallopeptidase [Bacteroidales bacterium]